ncbi:MAG: hypothetical protein HZC55_08840 [Verrucomicrobia bacterium]|nr:hypothetical protein [Verrucomicrobiota bacterium]
MLLAQPSPPPGGAPARPIAATARSDARAALKNGQADRAFGLLLAGTRATPRGPAVELQAIAELCSIARELESSEPGAGRAVALTARTEGLRVLPRLSRRDAAALESHLGELHEGFLSDRSRARAHYQAALGLDASRRSAREGLARLNRLEALLQSRARDSATLRRRNP